jgi:hypothetical protein
MRRLAPRWARAAHHKVRCRGIATKSATRRRQRKPALPARPQSPFSLILIPDRPPAASSRVRCAAAPIHRSRGLTRPLELGQQRQAAKSKSLNSAQRHKPTQDHIGKAVYGRHSCHMARRLAGRANTRPGRHPSITSESSHFRRRRRRGRKQTRVRLGESSAAAAKRVT